MSLSNKENLLNLKYDFLRRSVISYYARCMNETDTIQQKHYNVPCDFEQLMSFVKDLFYAYLQQEYKGIIKNDNIRNNG